MNNCSIKYFKPLFDGLTHNKYLKRLDVNNNCVDCEVDMSAKIIECFSFNKYLEEFRCRFSNLNETVLVSVIKGVGKNRKLKILDIS